MNEMMWFYEERDFKQIARMSKDSFLKLLGQVQDDDVFKTYTRNKQCPVWVQLMVVLQRLDCDGNGISVVRCARNCGYSNGSVDLFTKRVFKAILKLRRAAIFWPDAVERKRISHRLATYHGSLWAVGVVDGTPVVFHKNLPWMVKSIGHGKVITQ